MSSDKILLLPDAVDVISNIVSGSGLTVKQEELIRMILLSCPVVSTPDGDAFRARDLEDFIKNFNQSVKYKDSSYLNQLRGLRVEHVAGVQEFIESKEYMDQKVACRPAVMEGMIELFESPRSGGYVECCLTGAERWGKSYMSYLAIPYMIYKLSCFHNPQLEYDMAPGTSIVFILQSKRYELSKRILFEQMSEMLRRSPYFMNHFPFDKEIKSELRFPKGIYVLPLGGADTAAIGMNIFGGSVDEMNFMAKVKYSARIESTIGEEQEYDQAERIYTAIIGRMRGTFMKKGKIPGKLLLISASNYMGDFTDKKIAESKRELEEYGTSSILVLKHTQWEVLPQEKFSGEKFIIELGNNRKPSRIIQSVDEAVDVDDVMLVPVEYRLDFERDLTSAMRRYVGFTTGLSKMKFIPYPELIQKAQDAYVDANAGRSLFKYSRVIIDQVVDPQVPDWETLVDLEYIRNCILDPSAAFSVHIDLAKSEDAAGLAIGRLYGYKLIQSSKYFDPKVNDFVEVRDIRAPVYMIDGALQIIPPPSGRQIDFELIRDLVLWLRGHLYIKWGTMDLYQSVMMIQSFRKSKIRAGVLSVDASIAPYTEVKLAIKDERILLPPGDALVEELRGIEKDREKDKIIHPQGGSKDVSDAVSGVVYMLQTKEASYGRAVSATRAARGNIQKPELNTVKNDEVRTIKVKRRIGEGNLGFVRRTRVL
jgi:hypothetical protein